MKSTLMPRLLPLFVLSFAFAGCSKKPEVEALGSTSNIFASYEYEEYGCKTGRHFASDSVEYCELLVNESINNGCAHSTRQKAYQDYCVGDRRKHIPQVSISESVPNIATSDSFDGTLEVVALGRIGNFGSVKTQQSGGAVMSTLEGTISITSLQSTPQVSIQTLLFLRAHNATITAPRTSCVFSVKNFGPIQRARGTMSFTLVGIDNNVVIANDPTGCYLTLKQIAREGLEVYFEGASAVLPTNASHTPLNANVVLQVR